MGSRDSRLAIAQAELVIDAIRRRCGLACELITMKTTGDRILDQPLDAIGGKGLFVKELDDALRSGRVDICVHSFKDLPTPDAPDLPVIAVTPREDPRDVLVFSRNNDPAAPDRSQPIGSSSSRRRLQLAELFPDWDCLPVRGNIDTRLRKLDEGRFGALALAAAGLKRLNLWDRVGRVFSIVEMIPAPCQGILAIQGRSGDDLDFLKAIDDPDTHDAARAERAFVATLGGGCTAPTAAHATTANAALELTGMYVGADNRVFRGGIKGKRNDAERLGRELAEKLKAGAGNG